MIYHVAKQGNDQNIGDEKNPFLTIQKAADAAMPGDTIIVHEGVYREKVVPKRGGLGNHARISYEAAEGEKVVIKGSEHIVGWEKMEGTVWKKVIPNSFFKTRNPYETELDGDWLISPRERKMHCGDVYLNGHSFYEAASKEEVASPTKRYVSPHETWGNREEAIADPEQTLYCWTAEVDEKNTTIYANFQGADPNREYVEINVREACFYPEKTGLNYITVRGFEMAHAATQWAPPTAYQEGMIGPNWAKGWIIEENILHDAKCSAVCLGKEASSGDNDFTKYRRKPGYQYQLESVFRAKEIGWSKERIGAHIVRNNQIYDCGQNGIVGHMGCIDSVITGNEIYRIAVKHEFYGHEIGGIKLHAAIDVTIEKNYIHDCTLGTWLDWQAQGVRVTKNVYHRNNRDFMIEVTHGPYVVDHNIFTSDYTFDNAAQGGAYAYNLCGGFTNAYPVLNRATPYHFPHSTEILGTALVYGGDDRWYQNIFAGGAEEGRQYGTALYDGAPSSMQEYRDRILSHPYGDVEVYEAVRQPVYIDGNAYFKGAKPFEQEKNAFLSEEKLVYEIDETEDGVYLDIELPEEMLQIKTEQITAKLFGMPRITEAEFENPDGTPVCLDEDITGVQHGICPIAGPVQSLQAGRNRIQIWRKK